VTGMWVLHAGRSRVPLARVTFWWDLKEAAVSINPGAKLHWPLTDYTEAVDKLTRLLANGHWRTVYYGL
jgi:hypothetical protein